jgi:hypothetical protein
MQCHIPEEWSHRNEMFLQDHELSPHQVCSTYMEAVLDGLSFIFYNTSIWTKNSCKCTINDCHSSYSSLVLLQKLCKQNGLTCVLRRAEVWMHHNVMYTLLTLFIFVASYLCQYSDWATCWLTAETGFSSGWRKDFSCQQLCPPSLLSRCIRGFYFPSELKQSWCWCYPLSTSWCRRLRGAGVLFSQEGQLLLICSFSEPVS